MALKATSVAVDALYNMPGVHEDDFTPQLEEAIDVATRQPHPQCFLIGLDIAQRSIKAADYFMKHKLCLATYNIDPLATYPEVIQTFIQEFRRQPVVAGPFLRYSEITIARMRDIIQYPQSELTAGDLTQGNGTIKVIIEAMTVLHNENLGVHTKEKSANNRLVSHFRKLSYEALSTSAELGHKISQLGLDLHAILQHFLITETAEANLTNEAARLNNKRKPKNRPSPASTNNNKKRKSAPAEICPNLVNPSTSKQANELDSIQQQSYVEPLSVHATTHQTYPISIQTNALEDNQQQPIIVPFGRHTATVQPYPKSDPAAFKLILNGLGGPSDVTSKVNPNIKLNSQNGAPFLQPVKKTSRTDLNQAVSHVDIDDVNRARTNTICNETIAHHESPGTDLNQAVSCVEIDNRLRTSTICNETIDRRESSRQNTNFNDTILIVSDDEDNALIDCLS